MEAPWVFIDRWRDTEVLVHIHSGLLLSHKKEPLWLRSNEVDKPRAYCTEWSKSERERQIWTHVYGIWKAGTDEPICRAAVEMQTWGRDVGTVREGGGGRKERAAGKHTSLHVKLDSPWKFAVWHRELKSRAPWQPRGVGWGGRWEGGSGGRGHTHTFA